MTNYIDRFSVRDGVLYSFENVAYPAISYQSSFHADLARVLQDPEQADVIYQSFHTHLVPAMTQKSDQDSFFKALLAICQMFGNPEYSPLEALLLTLEEEGNSWVNQDQDKLSLLHTFVNEVNDKLKQRLIPTTERNRNKVIIITTSASGGCEAVAYAMKDFLDKRHVETLIIDTEKIAEKHDPIKYAVGVTFDSLYYSVVQQANKLEDGRHQQEIYDQMASLYIRPTQGSAIKEIFRREKPFLFFSTCQYRTNEVAYAYSTGIPGFMIHCDYGIESPAVMHLIGKVHPQQIKWLFPCIEPYIFQTYLERTGQSSQLNGITSRDRLFEEIASRAKVPLATICEQFEHFGYPVSTSIFRIVDQGEIERLRSKWEIAPDEKVVVIEMAKYGVGVLEDIFMDLLRSPAHTAMRIKYHFVCGYNKDLYQKLTSLLSNIPGTALNRCAVFGFLPLEHMNEIRNLATLGCSKLGGATTSQYIKLQLPMLVLFFHPWEKGNCVELERQGLYYERTELPLYQRVEQCIQDIEKKKTISTKDQNESNKWQSALLRLVKLENGANLDESISLH